MCIMGVERVHHLAICGSYSSKMRFCLSRWRQYMFQSSRDVNVMPWYSIGVVACSTSWNKQVTSDRKKHISMAFRLCVLGCALWELSAYITLPFVGLIHPRWGFVYPVEGNTCSSRPGHVNVIPWYSIGEVQDEERCLCNGDEWHVMIHEHLETL